MSRDPESGELDTATPNVINMAPGQPGVMPQPLFNPMQYQSFDPAHPGPYVIQQGYPVHFEVSPQNDEIKAQELAKQLDQGWYLCYRYLVVVIGIVDVFGVLNSLNLLSDRSQVDVALFSIFVAIWDVYQLYTIYQAMCLKDLKLARRAVKMMQISMILVAVGTIIQFNQISDSVRLQNGAKPTGGEYVFIFVFTLTFMEGLFYLMYYFGAKKVKGVLIQISALRPTIAGYSQVPNP